MLEKNDDVGGTWLENSYPGCRVDVSNLFYCYSFAQRDDWPQHFSTQEVLLDYFRGVADHHGLRPLIRFGTEVLAAELDEATMSWKLQLREPTAANETLEADAVVSGVGQLNRPNVPDLPAPRRSPGPAFHSARWDHDVDLRPSASSSSAPAPAPPSSSRRSRRRPRTSRSSSAPRPGSCRRPTTTTTSSRSGWLLRNVPGYANWLRFWTSGGTSRA